MIFSVSKFTGLIFILSFGFLISGCGVSVPSLETPECTSAKPNVKSLYSYHFDNDMKPSAENLKMHERFLSKELFTKLSASKENAIDYFTQTENYPKAFRIGGCQTVSPDIAVFEIALLWRDGERSEERKIKVESVKENGNWLVNKVEQ